MPGKRLRLCVLAYHTPPRTTKLGLMAYPLGNATVASTVSLLPERCVLGFGKFVKAELKPVIDYSWRLATICFALPPAWIRALAALVTSGWLLDSRATRETWKYFEVEDAKGPPAGKTSAQSGQSSNMGF